MQRSRFASILFASSIAAAGALMLAVLIATAAAGSDQLPGWDTLVLWFGMLWWASVAPLPLPRIAREVTLSPALQLGALLVLGAPVATLVSALAGGAGLIGQRWGKDSAVHLGRIALAVGCAGCVYRGLGGTTGSAWVEGTVVRALVASMVAYTATYVAITLGHERFAARAVRLHWRPMVLVTSSAQLFLASFAVPLALVQTHAGAWGTALFFLPLALSTRLAAVWSDGKRNHIQATRTLMSAIDAADPVTRGHSYRIARICVRLGRHFGMSAQDLEQLEYAALLHDIGRTAIQRDILFKPGTLTNQEQQTLRTHPRFGHEIVKQIGFLPVVADIVYAHHEQPDGEGYPRSLRPADIPLASRIIMGVAAFDAMTSDRPYRRGLQPTVALDELLKHAGTQFFPDIVEAIIDLYSCGSLYDEFAPEVIEQYANGDGNSRAIELHLENLGIPVQREPHAPEIVDDVPVLDLPTSPDDLSGEIVACHLPLTADGSWQLTAVGLSDIGCVRTNNEDAFGIYGGDTGTRGSLLVVADGMGGEVGGEVASRLAVETVRAAFFGDEGPVAVRQTLRSVVELANEVIHARAHEDKWLTGMGTTCVAVSVVGSEVIVAHVGDSRAYHIKGGEIQRLTKDHNLAEELLVAVGSRGPEGSQNVLTRSLGHRPEVQVDVTKPLRLDEGDVVLLCSDGLSNLVGSEEILAVVGANPPEVASTRLVQMARQRGGPDNITVVIARVEHV